MKYYLKIWQIIVAVGVSQVSAVTHVGHYPSVAAIHLEKMAKINKISSPARLYHKIINQITTLDQNRLLTELMLLRKSVE